MDNAIIKFVDNGNYFMELEGPNVSLYSITTLSASATITVTPLINIDDGDYFIIVTPITSYYAWLDKIGDSSGNPMPANLTEIHIDISTDVTTEDIADSINTTLNAITGLTTSINSSGEIELDIDDSGECVAPYDYNTGFIFSNQLNGENKNGLIKTSIPNNDVHVVKIYDAEYNSTLDVLTVLCKIRHKISLGKIGYEISYTTESKVINNWLFE